MYASLFDRFAKCDDDDPGILADELGDLLGGRRVYADAGLGVLAWGMPPLPNVTPATDQRTIAACIADALQRFEPRLERVRVTPDDSADGCSFLITATLVEEPSAVNLRIFSPYTDGSLGAKVEVVRTGDAFGEGATS